MIFFKQNSGITCHVLIQKAKSSAGSAAKNKTIKSGARDLAQLQLYIVIPKGYYGRIVGRSGLVFRKIILHCGTVDSDYCATVCHCF